MARSVHLLFHVPDPTSTSFAQTSDGDWFQHLQQRIDSIPNDGSLKCILAGVGLQATYVSQLQVLADSGKMDLFAFESTEQITEAFDIAAETIIQLSGGYIA